jgi:hypothetical protein
METDRALLSYGRAESGTHHSKKLAGKVRERSGWMSAGPNSVNLKALRKSHGVPLRKQNKTTILNYITIIS